MKMKTHYLKKTLAWLLPHTCILCGFLSTRPQDLCEHCYAQLPFIKQSCSRCGKPIETALCTNCLQSAPPFDSSFGVFVYQAPITKLVMNLKFGKSLVNARLLGELMLEKILSQWYQHRPLPQAIIPVPLHKIRLKERGFNQALEIARPIAKQLKIPIEYEKSARLIHTLPQATLSAKSRGENMQNVFWIAPDLDYKHIAVIDDVITTGQTISAFCSALRKTSINQIDVWCCARPML